LGSILLSFNTLEGIAGPYPEAFVLFGVVAGAAFFFKRPAVECAEAPRSPWPVGARQAAQMAQASYAPPLDVLAAKASLYGFGSGTPVVFGDSHVHVWSLYYQDWSVRRRFYYLVNTAGALQFSGTDGADKGISAFSQVFRRESSNIMEWPSFVPQHKRFLV
jgi:hypothetical protein